MGVLDFLFFGLVTGAIALVFVAAYIVAAVLTVMDAYKAKRTGWWIYLICMFLNVLGLVAMVAWWAYFKNNPTRLGSSNLSL